MDPLLDLARHPDIVEAIERVRDGDAAPAAKELLVLKSLANEHRNAWVTEVAHEFYKQPALARFAWVELRYCKQFVTDIARRSLQRHEKARSWVRTKPAPSIPKAIAEQTDHSSAALAWAEEWVRSPVTVNACCKALDALPDPPLFIRDLIGPALPFEERDRRVQELLEHPELLRADLPEYSSALSPRRASRSTYPVPFSFVQESELRQIGETRQSRGEDPLDPCKDPQLPATFRWHAARRAFDMNLCGLAFSGGGIRSATFNLGVLQTLAQ